MPDWIEAIRERLAPARLDPIAEDEVIEELAQHLDERYQELCANGLPDEECRRRALAELDSRDLLMKGMRFTRRPYAAPPALGALTFKRGWMPGLMHDLTIALRNIRIRPSFSLMVVGMLALGVAGNAAIFSIFNSLFLRPLPFDQSGRLVDLDETAPKWGLKYVGVSNIDLFEWRKTNSTFDGMAFFRGASYNLVDREIAQRVIGAQVTYNMLDALGLKPVIGRNFLPEEDKPPGARVALLSYALWQRMFRSDNNVLGRVLKLDEQPYSVIGVLPREAVFPDRTDLWTPLGADPNVPAGNYVTGVGRLKPSVSVEQARTDLLRIHKAMITRGHKVNEITSPVVTPLRDRYLGDFKTISRVLLGAVSVVLLIACVNIAALMLVRGSSRTREIAIRTAIGASNIRIVTQLLTENLVLAAAGGTLGILLGTTLLRAMVSQMPQQVPQWINFSLDARFAIFCVAITGAASLFFGLAPILQASRLDVRGALQDSVGRATFSRGRQTALGVFVVCEIGLALMLSIGASLLVQAFRKVLQVDPGFRPENVITFRTSLPDATYSKPELKIAYYDKLLERLQALPGVKAVGATSTPPLGGQWGGVFEAEGGRNAGAQGENPIVLRVAATPGYFDAIGMTLLDGRIFGEQDNDPKAQLVVLVNETFAKHFWGNGTPVGKRIRHPGGKDWYQVIGLLRDEKHYGIDQEMKPSVFHPYATTIARVDRNDARALQPMNIVMRGFTDPKVLVGPAREIVRQLDSDVPMYAVLTMTEQLDRSLWSRRAGSWVLGVFAAVAILLAVAGVYGMVSYSVAQRTQEIGIRVALGAQPGQVLRQVLLSGMSLVFAGVAVGLLGALAATRLLRTLLFGVSSSDPVVYATMALGIVGVTLLANFLPARRAAAVDPMRALHFE
jgi:putative ABC transport system permease protein